MEQIIRIGMDTSKHVFQLHGVNAAEVPILRKKLRRKEMVAFFEKLAPTVIAIEACGASHHWARLRQSFGHTVKLIPAQRVNAGMGSRTAQLPRSAGCGFSKPVQRNGPRQPVCALQHAGGDRAAC